MGKLNFDDFCRTNIQFVSKDEMQKKILAYDYKTIMLVASESAVKRSELQEFVQQLHRQCEVVWIKDSVTYPTQESLRTGLMMLQQMTPQAIIAIGGGRAIDFAKGIKAFYRQNHVVSEEDISALLQKKEIYTNKMDIIAVPTTAGTGAEVTKWDKNKECKYSIDDNCLKPDVALVVPELTVKANAELTLSTGLDSIAHAMEAYWSKKTNPMVRALAKQSISITVEILKKIIEEPMNLALREEQSLAAVMSGLAFSMTRTTACHSISYPLTMQYNIPHGVGVAMTLAQVAERNRGAFPEEKELFMLFKKFGGIQNFLEQVCDGVISLKLNAYNVKKQDIPYITQHSNYKSETNHKEGNITQHTFTLGRMDNNPVAFSQQDVIEILEEVYE